VDDKDDILMSIDYYFLLFVKKERGKENNNEKEVQ